MPEQDRTYPSRAVAELPYQLATARLGTQESENKVTLVLGMHRSGTSVVARSLRCFRIELGQHLVSAAAENPKGYFEDFDIVRSNELILRELGAAWNSPPNDGNRALEAMADGKLGERVRRQLLSKGFGARHLGIKDPRLCVLLPFWRRVLTVMNADVTCIIVFRHPLCVAASLRKHRGLSSSSAVALWLRYSLDAVTEVKASWPAAFVEQERLLAEPVAELARIGRALNFRLDDEQVHKFQHDFLDGSLSHYCARTFAEVDYCPAACRTFLLLQQAAGESRAAHSDALASYVPLREQVRECLAGSPLGCHSNQHDRLCN